MAVKKKSTPKKTASNRKTSTVIHRSEKPIKDLIELLGEIERTIRELTILMAESTPSKHQGLRGLPKLTSKQIIIKEQIEAAQRRYDFVLKMIEFLDRLPNDNVSRRIGDQLLRSGTSILGNYIEGQSASSKKDFIT